MLIPIPAIDLLGGRCVRLAQGDYAQQTVYGDDPVAMALRWQAAGGQRLRALPRRYGANRSRSATSATARRTSTSDAGFCRQRRPFLRH